jgi:hypothetical protein
MPRRATHRSDGDVVRFAVLSDVHAIGGHRHSDETYACRRTSSKVTRNPLAAIKQLIADHDLTAQAVLCPGDLTNRMETDGLKYAWEEVDEIARLLRADTVIATAGNHDVIRYEDLPSEADGTAWVAPLQSLDPVFPSRDRDQADEYFGEEFTIVEKEMWRVVALNSCARHDEEGEYSHGKIDEKTLTNMAAAIGADPKPINVLLCHHHPIEWNHLDRHDTSHMRGGEQLLRFLEQEHDAHWLFLHGHRHIPALGYAGETASQLVRFSAGSLGVYLEREGRRPARNQFYMLEFDISEIEELNLTNAGRFRAWNFNYNSGMTAADLDGDLPGQGGFGFRRSSEELADMCKETARSLGTNSVSWKQLCVADRRWLYVAPRDLQLLRRTLTTKHTAKIRPREGRQRIEAVSFR